MNVRLKPSFLLDIAIIFEFPTIAMKSAIFPPPDHVASRLIDPPSKTISVSSGIHSFIYEAASTIDITNEPMRLTTIDLTNKELISKPLIIPGYRSISERDQPIRH